MTIGNVTPTEQFMTVTDVFAANDIRTLVANHLGVSVDRVTDEAHFINDLGTDWLDRLELMMVVEDQFAGVEITGADVDRIKVVGDLIRHIETVDKERRRQGAAPVVRKLFGLRLSSHGEADQTAKRLRGSSPLFFETWGRRDAKSRWLVP